MGQPQASADSIAGYGFKSDKLSTCTVASIRSLIAARNRTTNVPDEQSVLAQLAAESKGVFTRSDEAVDANAGLSATPGHYATIVQKVLAKNGIQTTIHPSYDSAKELVAALIVARRPAMINLQREGTKEDHSVTVQWVPNAAGEGQGRFLINNVTTTGETQVFTKEQVEQGQITANIKRKGSAESPRLIRYRIDYGFPVIIANAP